MATSDPASQTSSVRRIAFTVVGALIFFFAISVLMERRTPSSSQARVQAFIVPMAAEVAGRISDVPVIDNSKVQEGDVLFRIDPVPFPDCHQGSGSKIAAHRPERRCGRFGIDAAQARAVEARANREKIRDQANRVFQLVERGVYPEAKYHELKGSLDASEAAVQAAEAELEKARRDLGATGSDNPQIREALAALNTARSHANDRERACRWCDHEPATRGRTIRQHGTGGSYVYRCGHDMGFRGIQGEQPREYSSG